jgi:hypothetical protein
MMLLVLKSRIDVSSYLVTEIHIAWKRCTGESQRSQNGEERRLASSCLSVCLSVRMEQLGSRWMNFHEI